MSLGESCCGRSRRIRGCARSARWFGCCGTTAPAGRWAARSSRGALEREDMWNQLLGRRPFSLLCAYSLDVLGKPASLQTVVDIAKLHGKVIGTVEAAA